MEVGIKWRTKGFKKHTEAHSHNLCNIDIVEWVEFLQILGNFLEDQEIANSAT